MNTPARIGKHPVHPMLVVFPIGLWVFSLLCDFAYAASDAVLWSHAAYAAIGGGIIGAALAIVPGWIDFWSLRGKEFKIAMTHMATNILALVLFIMSFLSRSIEAPHSISMTMSVIGVVAVALAGWLGGDLVYVRGVAVEPSGRR